ncbi:uncharacterized protein LOC104582750 isoform X2 [Brachypodium distachyon]|uniref:DRBM domain-containing protein n=1 Tax=Brachypodium distachyon TaxID=15368 RepID=A0A0Q3K9D6_BRADI|nr:uncharacterized protein LOC104582750 isoform X2 [Brachypodium distachyon]KQK07513.1 hypothetical protein BRADI_2g35940v3 [Brachypodium distachyon]|eukprot:XP_010231706.1 uncharacterized protein LOC104582750 isoform X2 [Brachypodium distachyon]
MNYGEEGGGGAGGEVVQTEDAVKMLVEHLVRPVLPAGARAAAVTPEMEKAVAQQIHTAVILYNYYHRNLSPQLAFADAKRFLLCASLSVGEDLFSFLSMVNEKNPGEDLRPSVTDRAVIDACEIAEALDASIDFPDMSLWPIAKVAVLLLDPTRKKCLIEFSSDTKGVWSIIEKEFDASAGNSHSSMLQQLAFTEVERRTGMKRSNLRLLGEDLTYSLSTKRTTTKLLIVEYGQNMNRDLMEMPLQELISSMTGPLFVNDLFLETSSVVEHYHILPYKQILLQLPQRNWPSDSALNEIAESVEQQESNSKSNMQDRNTKVPTPKQTKQAVKSAATNSNNSCNSSKRRKKNKQTYEAETTAAVNMKGRDGESPLRVNDSLIVVDVDASKLASKSGNTKPAEASAGKNTLQAGVHTEQKQSIGGDDITPTVFPTKAPTVDHVTKNIALEGQNMGVPEKSGGITENENDQMFDSLQSIKKIRDDLLHKQNILAERSAQCDMDIQTILSEGKLTPTVISIVDKYMKTSSNMAEVANSSCSGRGDQTLTTKRIKLKEAPLQRNKCQELDEISRNSNWILPRYTVLPSENGMFDASVHLRGLDFEIRTKGGHCKTPHEARKSAAASMIDELFKKAEEEKSEEE